MCDLVFNIQDGKNVRKTQTHEFKADPVRTNDINF